MPLTLNMVSLSLNLASLSLKFLASLSLNPVSLSLNLVSRTLTKVPRTLNSKSGFYLLKTNPVERDILRLARPAKTNGCDAEWGASSSEGCVRELRFDAPPMHFQL